MNESTKDAWLGIGAAHHTKERRVSCDTSVPSASRIRATGQNHFHAPCKQPHSHAVRACACARVRLRGLVLVHLFAPARVGADSVLSCRMPHLPFRVQNVCIAVSHATTLHHVAPCCMLHGICCKLYVACNGREGRRTVPPAYSAVACCMLDVGCRMSHVASSFCLYVHAGADHHCHRRIHARVCARPPVRVRKPGLPLAGNPHSCARHATQLGSFRVQRRARVFGGIRNAYRHTLAALRAPHRKRRMRARDDARARGCARARTQKRNLRRTDWLSLRCSEPPAAIRKAARRTRGDDAAGTRA